MDISRIIYVLRAIGLRGIVRTIQYGFIRDRIEKQFASKTTLTAPLTPGNLVNSQSMASGIQLDYEHAQADLVFLSPCILRVSWKPGKPPAPYTLDKSDWPVQQPDISLKSLQTEITSKNIYVAIDIHGGMSLGPDPKNIVKSDEPPIQEGKGWRIRSRLIPGEHIYGLGERAGHLNLRPGKYTSWNTDIGGSYSHGVDPLYIGTPTFLSISNQGSYLVYFENSFYSSFNIDKQLEVTFSGGMLRYYFILGSLDQIFKHYADLTGYPFMPPRWSLGYHQSRWSYQDEEEIYSVVDGFRKNNLPLSAIHLDIDYMDGFRLFTFNPKRFGNIRKMTHDLEAKGIQVVTSINPAIKHDPNYSVYSDGHSKDMYCKLPDGKVFNGVSWPGWCVFPDFTDPVARSWWQTKYQVLLDAGVSGIWHDMNEPASFAAWGDKSFPHPVTHSMEAHAGDHLEAHNIYGLLMDQSGFEALRNASPTKRPWILSRSGWASMQRYAWNWTGDVETSWEALQQTIPTILGLGLSGHGFSGVDIGGFSGSPTAELYLRWFQLATFLPFFRTHSAVGTQRREPWVFGEPTTSIIRKFLKLRYQLLPYIYTLTWSCTQTGLPPVRPLFWEDPSDEALWDIEDEFLLGDDILVVPILHSQVSTRKVVLPPGNWYSYWDDKVSTGSQTIEVPITDDTIPLYIKGGCLLPMEEDGQLTMHLYPGNASPKTICLYSDSGDGYAASRVDTFDIHMNPSSLEIAWQKTGNFPFPYPSFKFQVHGIRPTIAVVDGVDFPFQADSFTIPVFQRMIVYFA